MASSLELDQAQRRSPVPSSFDAAFDPDIDVRVEGPFALGTVVWQRAPGEFVCTIVAKATYALENELCPLLDEPDPIQVADDHWDDDPAKSVRVPSDLALFKSTYDVVIVGHAHAPDERPVHELVVRAVVGSVDKCVDARVAARIAKDGTTERGAPALRMPLRYETAAGGLGTGNPVGIDATAFDAIGRRYRLPQLLPHNHILIAGQHVPAVGLGPIAESWPLRAERLRPQDRAWLAAPLESPMPSGFDPRFFSVAPADQRAVEPFRDDERLLLECLHPKDARLVTNLAGVHPKLRHSEAIAEVGPLVADTLVIDGERGVVTLTFRAIAKLAAPPSTSIRPRRSFSPPALETTDDSDPLPGVDLPFADPPTSLPAPTPHQDSVLPFRAPLPSASSRPGLLATQSLPTVAALPPSLQQLHHQQQQQQQQRQPTPPPTTPPPSFSSASPPPAPPPTTPPPAMAPPPLADRPAALAPASVPPAPAPAVSSRARTIGELRAGEQPAMLASQPPSGARSRLAELVPPAPPPSQPERPPTSDVRGIAPPARASAPTSARAASDGAVPREPERAPPPPKAIVEARGAPVSTTTRRAMVDLLHFDAGVPRRLRRTKAYADLLVEQTTPRGLRRTDDREADADQERDDRARLDVLRLLSCGTELDAPALRRAAEVAATDPNDLEIPLFLVAGDLRPSYDEIEQLKTAVRIAQPLATSDKRLAGLLAVANEMCGGAVPAPAERIISTCKQIEAATQQANLPPRFLADAVERHLLEQRAYKKRLLFGQPRIRADFVFPGGAMIPAYTPETVAPMFPLLPAFPCVALVELRPREDLLEQHADALVIVALGRLMRRVRD